MISLRKQLFILFIHHLVFAIAACFYLIVSISNFCSHDFQPSYLSTTFKHFSRDFKCAMKLLIRNHSRTFCRHPVLWTCLLELPLLCPMVYICCVFILGFCLDCSFSSFHEFVYCPLVWLLSSFNSWWWNRIQGVISIFL